MLAKTGFRWIFSILSFGSLSGGVFFSFGAQVPNYAMTAIWLTFSLFTFALGWSEIAESISFLGSNIKLREVKDAIKELKQLAEIDISALFEIIQTQMRFGGVAESRKREIFDKCTKVLKQLNFSQKEIRRIQSNWHRWVEGDYIRAIIGGNNTNHPAIPKMRQTEWRKKYDEIHANVDNIQPKELRELFRGFEANNNNKLALLIGDFEYYRQNKKHKSLDRWEECERGVYWREY